MVKSIQSKNLSIIVFVVCFLSLMVDGMDLQILSLTLPSLEKEFHIDKAAAGLLGTWSLAGMAIGGITGGWLADRFWPGKDGC